MVILSGVLNDVPSNDGELTNIFCGALLGNYAPYAAVEKLEFLKVACILMPNCKEDLDPVPKSLFSYSFRKYGCGQHSSSKSAMLGSIVLSILSGSDTKFMIRHVVLQGSSQYFLAKYYQKSGYPTQQF